MNGQALFVPAASGQQGEHRHLLAWLRGLGHSGSTSQTQGAPARRVLIAPRPGRAWGRAGAPGTPPPSTPSTFQRKCRQGKGGGAGRWWPPCPWMRAPSLAPGWESCLAGKPRPRQRLRGTTVGPGGPSRDTGHGCGDQAFIGGARAGAGAQCPAGQQAHRARRSACSRRRSVCKATRGTRVPPGGTQKSKLGGRPAPGFPLRPTGSQDS